MGQNGSTESQRRGPYEGRYCPYDPPPGNNPDLFLLEQEHKRERTGSFGGSRKKDRYVLHTHKQERFSLDPSSIRQRSSSETEPWLLGMTCDRLKRTSNVHNSTKEDNTSATRRDNSKASSTRSITSGTSSKDGYVLTCLGKSPRQGKRRTSEHIIPIDANSLKSEKGLNENILRSRSSSFSGKDEPRYKGAKERYSHQQVSKHGSVREMKDGNSSKNSNAGNNNWVTEKVVDGSNNSKPTEVNHNDIQQPQAGLVNMSSKIPIAHSPQDKSNDRNAVSKHDKDSEKMAMRRLESYRKKAAHQTLVGIGSRQHDKQEANLSKTSPGQQSQSSNTSNASDKRSSAASDKSGNRENNSSRSSAEGHQGVAAFPGCSSGHQYPNMPHPTRPSDTPTRVYRYGRPVPAAAPVIPNPWQRTVFRNSEDAMKTVTHHLAPSHPVPPAAPTQQVLQREQKQQIRPKSRTPITNTTIRTIQNGTTVTITPPTRTKSRTTTVIPTESESRATFAIIESSSTSPTDTESSITTASPVERESNPMNASITPTKTESPIFDTSPIETEISTTSLIETEISTSSPIKTEIATTSPIDTEISTSSPIETEIATTSPIDTEISTTSLIETEISTSSPIETEIATTSSIEAEIRAASPTEAQNSIIATSKTDVSTPSPTNTESSLITPTDIEGRTTNTTSPTKTESSSNITVKQTDTEGRATTPSPTNTESSPMTPTNTESSPMTPTNTERSINTTTSLNHTENGAATTASPTESESSTIIITTTTKGTTSHHPTTPLSSKATTTKHGTRTKIPRARSKATKIPKPSTDNITTINGGTTNQALDQTDSGAIPTTLHEGRRVTDASSGVAASGGVGDGPTPGGTGGTPGVVSRHPPGRHVQAEEGGDMYMCVPVDPRTHTLKDQNRNKTTKSASASTVISGPAGAKRAGNQPDVVRQVAPPGSAAEISRLEALCEARTKQLNIARMQLKTSAQGFDAMTVLVKYLTEELDAFSCPEVTAKLRAVKGQLKEAQQQIDLLAKDKASLEKSLGDLKTQHAIKVTQVKHAHREELQQLQRRLLAEKNEEVEKVVEKYSLEVTTLKSFLEKNITDMKSKHEKMLAEHNVQQVKEVEQLKEDHDERCQDDAPEGATTDSLAETLDLQKQHERRMEEITRTFENIKLTLSEKVESLRGECEEMRSREAHLEARTQREADMKIHMALTQYKHLPAEIESLKAVMEMRNQELHELRHRKLELEKQLEEIPVAREKIISLQQKVENLEAVIQIKADYEKQLAEKHQLLLRKFDKEYKANKRLSMDNEELAWRLANSAESPDLLRRSISHSPTRASAEQTPEVVRRRKSPACSIPTSPRNQTEFDRSPVTLQSPPKSNLKRSGTYDLLNKDPDEKEIKQSDV